MFTLADLDWWIEALESGRYKQARKRLLAPDGSRCCLGVLCDRFGIEPVAFEGVEWGTDGEFSEAEYKVLTQHMETLDKAAHGAGLNYDYTGWNDEGESFVDIAARLRNFRHLLT